MKYDKIYEVAGHRFGISGSSLIAALERTRAFNPFEVNNDTDEVEFRCLEGCKTDASSSRKELYRFRCVEADGVFVRTASGYRLDLIHDRDETLVSWVDEEARSISFAGKLLPCLVKFALWMGYGVLTVHKDTLAMHSSCIVKDGLAVLFLGESGTGKSTHTRLWREHIEGSWLLNDDSPILRFEEGRVYAYGSPWSGKTPCYVTERYPLAACVRLSQAPQNKMQRLTTIQAFAAVHPSAVPAFAYDDTLYDGVCRMFDHLLSSIPVLKLECLPNAEAARLSYSVILGHGA